MQQMLGNGSYSRTYGAPSSSNYPRFFIESVQDLVASEREGRPIFHDEERVEIIMPGNPLTRPVHKVTDADRQEWPEQYKAFKSGLEISPDGTPLEQWPILKRAQVLELKALGFLTVEHLSLASDLALQRVGMAGRRLKDLAIAYLDDAQNAALSNKLAAENERKDAEIAALKMQVEQLAVSQHRLFEEMQTMKNAPNPLATFIPGMHDPVAQSQQLAVTAPGASSLASLPEPRRRGRPPKPQQVEPAVA